jgi:predicted protein tyrosine phosphatase
MAGRLKILFVCGKNQWRSPTAERVYAKDPRLSVRSAGLSSKSPHELSADDLQWADLVLVMERSQISRIRSSFASLTDLPPVESLDIPDEFKFMDSELILLLRAGTEHCIEAYTSEEQT